MRRERCGGAISVYMLCLYVLMIHHVVTSRIIEDRHSAAVAVTASIPKYVAILQYGQDVLSR